MWSRGLFPPQFSKFYTEKNEIWGQFFFIRIFSFSDFDGCQKASAFQ